MSDGSGVKILVADDDDLILSLVCRMLRALGCEVTGARNGREALGCFEREGFDLVLTDLQMPYMDGWELALRVKSRAPQMPVIAMTGMGREEVMSRQGKSALDQVLFKPLTRNQLDQAVAEAVESRRVKSG